MLSQNIQIPLYLQFGGVNGCFDHDRGGFVLGARVQVQIVVVPILAAEISTAGAATFSIALRWTFVVSTFHCLFTGNISI